MVETPLKTLLMLLLLCQSTLGQVSIKNGVIKNAKLGQVVVSGGGAVWVDIFDFSLADGESQGQTSVNEQNTLRSAIFVSGTIDQIRFKTGPTYTGTPTTAKIAIYDASRNIVGSTTYYPTITVNAASTVFTASLGTPVAVVAGDIVCIEFPDGNVSIATRTTGAVTTHDYGNYVAYASFPSATIDTFSTSTIDLAIGLHYQ